MNILITGGAGYIGTVLIEELLKNTEIDVQEIIVYDNLLYKQNGLFGFLHDKRIKFIYGDVNDEQKLKPYVSNADVIVPLAAIVGFPACDKDKKLAWQTNAEQIKFIAEHSKSSAHIVLPNTNSGYGIGQDGVFCTEETPLNPLSVYGKSKCAGENYALASGKAISLRLATVFGVSHRFRKDLLVNDFVLKALTDKYIVLFEADFKRNYIHVRDVAKTFIYMIKNFHKYRGQIFNVGLTEANLSKKELCEKIKKFIPEFVIKIDDFNKDLDKRNYIVSNKKLESTGWSSKYSIELGIQELISAYPIIINSHTKYTNL